MDEHLMKAFFLSRCLQPGSAAMRLWLQQTQAILLIFIGD
jgi:hypothetical protein